MRIGVLGGTFDPIHVGHLIIADRVREEAGLDEIWFMPALHPPHKEDETVTDAGIRLELVKAAVRGVAGFRVSELEYELGGASYTIETATALSARYPEDRFFWIVGGDMVAYLPNFHRIEELVRLIGFIGVKRPGYEDALADLPKGIRDAVMPVEVPLVDISSTDIRQRIRSGKSIRFLLPDAVADLIREKGLYGC